jgi:RimJ/RimL family protein N-acetyltransferase
VRRQDHLEWLRSNIHLFKVICRGRDVCGAIRVQDGEVSIWLDRQFRGTGVAVEAIKRVSRKGFTARVVHGNVASMICFIKSGYWPVALFDRYCLLRR